MHNFHLTTGYPKLDFFLSILGTVVAFGGTKYATEYHLPIWAQWMAWIVALCAGTITVINGVHLLHTRIKENKVK